MKQDFISFVDFCRRKRLLLENEAVLTEFEDDTQQCFSSLSCREVETEPEKSLSSNTNFSFELENGHFANIYINKR